MLYFRNFLLLFLLGMALKSAAQVSEIVVLQKQLELAKEDTSRLRIYSELSWQFLTTSIIRSRQYAEAELQLAQKIDNDFYIASGYNDIGIVLIRENRFRESIQFHKKALEIRTRMKDKAGMASSYSKLGHCYTELNQLTEGHDAQLKALALFEEINDEQKVAYTLNNLCVIYMNLSQFDKLEKYANESYRVLNQLRDTAGIANSLNHLAIVAENKGDFKTALQLELKSVEYREIVLDSVNLEGALNNVGIYYRKLGKSEEGLKYYSKALAIAEKLGNTMSIALYKCNIGNAYMNKGKYVLAEKYLKEAEALTIRDSISYNLPQLYSSLGELYLNLHQNDLSLSYFDKSARVKDSLFSESMAEKFTEMETRYETERTEQENALLQKENQLKSEALTRSRFINISIIVLVVLLAFLTYLLFNRKQLQNKRKRDAELLQQQELRSRAAIEAEERERVRIARELHDGIGQQLSAAKLTLSGLGSLIAKEHPQQELLFQNATQLIDDAVKEVRSVSHSMMANALIKAGLAGAVRDFVQKVSDSGSLKVDLEIVDLNERLDPTVETVLFRVLQEVVNNIIRHAQASVISIQLIRHDDELVLVVEDNGIGFNVSKHSESEGIGLRNIRSRVEYLNGNLNIDSYPGKGTTITVEIPLK